MGSSLCSSLRSVVEVFVGSVIVFLACKVQGAAQPSYLFYDLSPVKILLKDTQFLSSEL